MKKYTRFYIFLPRYFSTLKQITATSSLERYNH